MENYIFPMFAFIGRLPHGKKNTKINIRTISSYVFADPLPIFRYEADVYKGGRAEPVSI